mgnify:CR=1 FL=1
MIPAPLSRQPSLRHRLGFSLIEALIALSITSIAGAVLLLSVQSSLDTTIEAVDKTIADGIAQQTIDEMRADEPGATDDQNVHTGTVLMRVRVVGSR